MTRTFEKLLRVDRAIVITGLTIITLLAWIYTINRSIGMTSTDDMYVDQMRLSQMRAWQAEDFVFNLTMWVVMMVAMMLPAAAPMILTYTGLNRRRNLSSITISATTSFLWGYLIVWFFFSVCATLLQWGFQSAGLLLPDTLRLTPLMSGVVLILAGIFQFTRLKDTCLSNCRTPLSFLTTEWRDGAQGALILGLLHGLYCLGCCWHLMILLFVAGVMNLLWVALIAGFILAEKLMPAGRWASRIGGLVSLGWGVWLLFQGTFPLLR